jgi:predicted ArsR family transcriptional regulator
VKNAGATTTGTGALPVAPRAAAPAVEDRTRDRLARTLLEDGPATAATLAARLGITPAAVRRHLDAMVAQGTVQARDAATRGARGRGRPAKLFSLTDSGREPFTQAYDDLASSAIRFLAQTGGAAAVTAFARARVDELEARYGDVVRAAAPEERTQVLAEQLRADGYAASARPAAGAGGAQLCQHHCPVAHVAAEFPQLCEAETEVFARLLGTHVQRLATIAHGDGVCTTYVPKPGQSTAHPAPGNSTTNSDLRRAGAIERAAR